MIHELHRIIGDFLKKTMKNNNPGDFERYKGDNRYHEPLRAFKNLQEPSRAFKSHKKPSRAFKSL